MAALWIKICGVTTVEDAEMVADAGADAIGLNFAPGSPRRVSSAVARDIVRAVGPRVEWVGVFVDADRGELERTRQEVGLDWLQLHGDEPPELAAALGPRAFKALRIGEAEDVELARRYGEGRVLVDAKVPGLAGGSGQRFDWALVEGLVQERPVILAGGLRPDNVARAVELVRPFGIDTASGVESAPGKKDAELVRRFVREARSAEPEE